MSEQPTVADETAAAVTAAYPGLRQAHPFSLGQPLADVHVEANGGARFAWRDYEVHVETGPPGHLNTDDVEDESLQRQVRARAVLLATETMGVPVRGHVEWEVTNPRPELGFPVAYVVAAADLRDPRFSSAVLAAVGLALDYAVIATRCAAQAAEAAVAKAP
ncbi:hypothetical protein ACFC58_07065 [Kitasatospora purpeofusca]|uniref:hypothetical protein n=1 Tax=Kitasatospora purpeofusca TaxID=67352 RepID=UPI0035DF5BD8